MVSAVAIGDIIRKKLENGRIMRSEWMDVDVVVVAIVAPEMR